MSLAALPPLNWLRAFEAAARHMSFTAAAVELHMTQSAVSQHIRSLESFLGKPLFDRRPRALSLTEDATNYLPAVREAFRVLQVGTGAFPGTRSSNSVTLQCSMGFATFRLMPRLGALLEAHPWISLNIVTPIWNPEQTAPMADIEIRFGHLDAISAQAIRLTEETFYPVCTPANATDADWLTMPLLDCVGVLATWPRWLAARGEVLPPDHPITLCSTYATSIGAAMAGVGMAMAHDSLVADALADGRLVRPFADSVESNEGYCLVVPPSHLRSRSASILTDWLVAEFGRTLDVDKP